MPRPDTGLGGSGYPSEMMTYDRKTGRYIPNKTQWRRQRGSAGPEAEIRGIANLPNNDSLWPYDKEYRIDDVEEYVNDVKDILQQREDARREQLRDKIRYSQYGSRAIDRMRKNGIQPQSSPQRSVLSQKIMAANKRRPK